MTKDQLQRKLDDANQRLLDAQRAFSDWHDPAPCSARIEQLEAALRAFIDAVTSMPRGSMDSDTEWCNRVMDAVKQAQGLLK